MNFVTIDFETAKYSRESACSVGLVKHLDGKAADTFYSLIRPPKLYIRPDFTDIHGLTVADVKDAPTFADIWDSDVKPFIGDLPLAAHNALDDAMTCGKLVLLSAEKFNAVNIGELLRTAGSEMNHL
jgi:DNA polymerase-3 subunit epsilon